MSEGRPYPLPSSERDMRAMCCEACEGSGKELVWIDEEYGYHFINQPCPCCEGTGLEIIDVEPINEDDLLTMEETLERDGQKLRQLTGRDHGPW
jgi:hypothetical protein